MNHQGAATPDFSQQGSKGRDASDGCPGRTVGRSHFLTPIAYFWRDGTEERATETAPRLRHECTHQRNRELLLPDFARAHLRPCVRPSR